MKAQNAVDHGEHVSPREHSLRRIRALRLSAIHCACLTTCFVLHFLQNVLAKSDPSLGSLSKRQLDFRVAIEMAASRQSGTISNWIDPARMLEAGTHLSHPSIWLVIIGFLAFATADLPGRRRCESQHRRHCSVQKYAQDEDSPLLPCYHATHSKHAATDAQPAMKTFHKQSRRRSFSARPMQGLLRLLLYSALYVNQLVWAHWLVTTLSRLTALLGAEPATSLFKEDITSMLAAYRVLSLTSLVVLDVLSVAVSAYILGLQACVIAEAGRCVWKGEDGLEDGGMVCGCCREDSKEAVADLSIAEKGFARCHSEEEVISGSQDGQP
jgi:hypothetical protein